MRQTTSIRLSRLERQSINEATEKLGMPMGDYFVRLHYAFWEVAKIMLREKSEEELSREQGVINKLKNLGVIEKDGRHAGIG